MFSKKVKISCFDLKKKINKKIKNIYSQILQKKNPLNFLEYITKYQQLY